jgi:hypothetical protein
LFVRRKRAGQPLVAETLQTEANPAVVLETEPITASPVKKTKSITELYAVKSKASCRKKK